MMQPPEWVNGFWCGVATAVVVACCIGYGYLIGKGKP